MRSAKPIKVLSVIAFKNKPSESTFDAHCLCPVCLCMFADR